VTERPDPRDDSARDATAPAVSPCIKVCQLDTQGRCYGCGRTRDEIARWSTMTLEERRAVNARLGFRGHGEHR
jgi:predicted Fe-S protein YdhL (DUF1289 family)